VRRTKIEKLRLFQLWVCMLIYILVSFLFSSLIYCPIRSSADCEALQMDLDSLEQWSSAWGMTFSTKNVKLCTSPVESHILPICITYDGHVLCTVQIAKYLGITLTHELSSHVHSIHSRANSTLGFLRRTLRRCSANLKRLCILR